MDIFNILGKFSLVDDHCDIQTKLYRKYVKSKNDNNKKETNTSFYRYYLISKQTRKDKY